MSEHSCSGPSVYVRLRCSSNRKRTRLRHTKRRTACHAVNDNCQQALMELKELFINAPILAHFEEDRETVVEGDSSGWATRAVLSQNGADGQLRPCPIYPRYYY